MFKFYTTTESGRRGFGDFEERCRSAHATIRRQPSWVMKATVLAGFLAVAFLFLVIAIPIFVIVMAVFLIASLIEFVRSKFRQVFGRGGPSGSDGRRNVRVIERR